MAVGATIVWKIYGENPALSSQRIWLMTHIRYKAVHTQEGDNAEVNRLFPLPGRLMHYDPFVLWDEFTVQPGAGFPTHPHRGFEAITYVFSGEMQHADNLGNTSTVGPGGAQRFTAGRGIEHSEMPGETQATRGIQLWINLPQRLKQLDPDYQEVPASRLVIFPDMILKAVISAPSSATGRHYSFIQTLTILKWYWERTRITEIR